MSPDPNLTRHLPTDEELERAAEITEQDIKTAIAAFNRHAPAAARGLLEADDDGERGGGADSRGAATQ